MISFGECYSCGACKAACPTDAIQWVLDENGFWCPQVRENLCDKCGLCVNLCPNKPPKMEQIAIYAGKHKNLQERLTSASGGVFPSLAEYILNLGGLVFGAVFDEKFQVHHIGVSDRAGVERLKDSKYTQSDVRDTFWEVSNALVSGQWVLYSGTPCQIAGLNNYLGGVNTKRLFTVDLVCHGVPSTIIFAEYLRHLEIQHKSNVINLTFRCKDERRETMTRVVFANGQEYRRILDVYYVLFLKNVILKESCYRCEFASMNRVSDITLGDFWGVGNTIKRFDDGRGVSLILINTEKGKRLFDAVAGNFELVESNRQSCLQPQLIEPSKKSPRYEVFWKDYGEFGFKYAANKFVKESG